MRTKIITIIHAFCTKVNAWCELQLKEERLRQQQKFWDDSDKINPQTLINLFGNCPISPYLKRALEYQNAKQVRAASRMAVSGQGVTGEKSLRAT